MKYLFPSGIAHPRYTGPRFCKICSKELVGRDSRRRGYCSDRCRSRMRRDLYGAKNPRWMGGRVVCQWCGTIIVGQHRTQRKFCTRKCVAQWQSKYLSRQSSPLWKGGSKRYSEYSFDFTAGLRERIRSRDHYRCRLCRKQETGRGRGQRLHVHHIDHNKHNSNLLNLISLCASCHRNVHNGKTRLNVG